MRKLELQGKILAYYPMPNLETKFELQSQWLKTCKYLHKVKQFYIIFFSFKMSILDPDCSSKWW